MSEIYKKSGVDVEAGYKAVSLMKKHIEKTKIQGVLGNVGGFGGAFELSSINIDNPTLVSATDGVGTKLILAFEMDKHDTIGIDVVAMCVNDISAMGAKPLFFLDYIATSKVEPTKIEEIVKGICEGCILAGCALIGGETAEMPNMYKENEYDLAGFGVGIVDKNKILTGENIKDGDIIIGIASSGIHSNGFSLVRKIIKDNNLSLIEKYDGLDKSLGEILLTPTRIYSKVINTLIEKVNILGISHITGGGFIENIPRVLPKGFCADIKENSWDILPIFSFMAKQANIDKREMYGVFNMGIGMAIVVREGDVDLTMETLKNMGENSYIIGNISKSENDINIKFI
ncbi:MAG: phosphoribosylformylglycinamidine cyclo-ligase [Defluviitaleaceae bacterium]|nr:phosphoribosylformylglycinamidine cyclo-ligase [Defluviitaleaceae bacterium]